MSVNLFSVTAIAILFTSCTPTAGTPWAVDRNSSFLKEVQANLSPEARSRMKIKTFDSTVQADGECP